MDVQVINNTNHCLGEIKSNSIFNRSDLCTFHYILGDYHLDRSCRLVSTVERIQKEWEIRLQNYVNEVDRYKIFAMNELRKFKFEAKSLAGNKFQSLQKNLSRGTWSIKWKKENGLLLANSKRSETINEGSQKIQRNDNDNKNAAENIMKDQTQKQKEGKIIVSEGDENVRKNSAAETDEPLQSESSLFQQKSLILIIKEKCP